MSRRAAGSRPQPLRRVLAGPAAAAEQALEQQRMERILSTPLETFGDQSVEDLAKKYEETIPAEGQTGEK